MSTESRPRAAPEVIAELSSVAEQTLLTRNTVEDWREDMNCISAPDFLYPENGASANAGRLLCGRCVVRDECLQNALAQRELYGMRGGLTAKERAKLLRLRKSNDQEVAEIYAKIQQERGYKKALRQYRTVGLGLQSYEDTDEVGDRAS